MEQAPSAEPADSPAEPRPLATRYDAVLLDLDGVVYRGDQAIPGAPEALERVRRLGIRMLFLTNNSARTPEQVAAKLEGIGVRAAPDEVLTSALATAHALGRELAGLDRGSPTAFVIGERGIREALSGVGIELLDGEPDAVDAVVIGWDRSVDYAKLRTAALLVQGGARLVATNADASYPAPDGLWPGAGAILAAVTTTTGATPLVVGKPHRPLFEAAARMAGATHPLVVGDRLDTDIAGAAAMGWDSMLVLTGAAQRAELVRSTVLPTYVGSDLAALLQDIPPARARLADEADADAGAVEALLLDCGLSPTDFAPRSTLVSEGSVPPATASTRRSSGPDRSLAATATLEDLRGEGYLRSVAVRPELRGKGVGTLMVAGALRHARERGLSRVWLLTESAEPFFGRLGFRTVGRDDLPESIRTSRQVAEGCAPSAVPMARDL